MRLFAGLSGLFLLASLAAAGLARAPGAYLAAVAACFITPFAYLLLFLRQGADPRRVARACVLILVPRVASLIPMLFL